MKPRHFLFFLLSLSFFNGFALVWYDGLSPVSYHMPKQCDPVVEFACGIFSSDMEAVTGKASQRSDKERSIICLYQLDSSSEEELNAIKNIGIDIKKLKGLKDGFAIKVKGGKIHVAGTNGLGLAYGMLELSREAGVSPWIWWGDVVPTKKEILSLADDFNNIQGASVESRGIVIKNDVWSLRPWSYLNFEPSQDGQIGTATYRKILELLLRLRANTLINTNFDESLKEEMANYGVKTIVDSPEMWTDDGYGYLTNPYISSSQKQNQDGGGGVYYHLSYGGEPHDYLWLTTTQPGLIWHQLRKAYDHNLKNTWIAEIHDPKIAGYDLELFLDLAWDIDSVDGSTIRSHYKTWLTNQFGEKATELIFPVMHNFYKLCGELRPEYSLSDSNLNPEEFGNELQRYVAELDKASYVVDYATKFVDPSQYDAYYTRVIYPVCASAAHARSQMKAIEARELSSVRKNNSDRRALEEEINQACAESQRAYQEVRKLTEYYNDVVSDGKWKWSMDSHPGDLDELLPPSLPVILTESEMQRYVIPEMMTLPPLLKDSTVGVNADGYTGVKGNAKSIGMLGHSMNAVALEQGSVLIYDFEVEEGGEGVIRVAMIPVHSIEGDEIRFSISLDGATPEILSVNEPLGSEEWKENVVRGQTIRNIQATLQPGRHKLEIKALDDNIVIDQWMWDPNPERKFYLFPIE